MTVEHFRDAGLCNCGDHGFVGLTGGKVALFDPDDLEWVQGRKWFRTRNKRRHVYAESGRGENKVSMHRKVVRAPTGRVVDHINGDTLDNRRQNLRVCSQAENTANQKASLGGASQYKGVFLQKSTGLWSFQVFTQGQRITGSGFSSELQAALAYDAAALHLHGKFARTNAMLGLLPLEGRST